MNKNMKRAGPALRLASLIAAAAFPCLASGCMQFEDEWTIYPDGSGKMALRFAFDLEILRKMEKFGADSKDLEKKLSFMDFTSEVPKLDNGFVALTKPRVELKDGWQILTLTAYFDDINKVKFGRAGEESKISFSFKKEGEGYALEIDDRLLGDPKLDQMDKFEEVPEDRAQAAWEVLKDFTMGMKLQRSVRMPGSITSVEGYASKNGRTALNKIGESDLKELVDVVKVGKFAKPAKRKVVCGKSELSEGDLAAFKKELDDAKAAWPKIQEEMKAEAEKKKKDREKDE